MHSFKDQTNEAQALKFYNLLPKKVRHTINRIRNQDKYKAALLMMKALRKDPDVISRGLTKARIQSIAADYFGLNHREFAKVLNRQTRYEEAPPGMSDTVKKFKKDGMDDEMAFSLAWSIYNKRNETINEEYLTEGKTSASTYFEQVIVACANSKNIEEVKAAPGYAGWLAEAKKDKKWKTDDTTLNKFRIQIQKISMIFFDFPIAIFCLRI